MIEVSRAVVRKFEVNDPVTFEDPGSRSFGQILGHVADANNAFCADVLGEAIPPAEVEKTKTTKAELLAALRSAFAYCGRAYDGLTDAAANETVKAYGQERNKLGVLWFNASHNLEHYGNSGGVYADEGHRAAFERGGEVEGAHFRAPGICRFVSSTFPGRLRK